MKKPVRKTRGSSALPPSPQPKPLPRYVPRPQRVPVTDGEFVDVPVYDMGKLADVAELAARRGVALPEGLAFADVPTSGKGSIIWRKVRGSSNAMLVDYEAMSARDAAIEQAEGKGEA
jgi:hypothetical protein